MKFLVKTDSTWTQNTTDYIEHLYNEAVPVKYGYGIVHGEVSKLAILPLGFNVVEEMEDDDERTLDDLIAQYRQKPQEEPTTQE